MKRSGTKPEGREKAKLNDGTYIMNNHTIILCTCPNEETATKIATKLVQEKFAACVNIIPNIRSIYTWKNKIENNSESLLIIKTKKELYKKVEVSSMALHPYECPEIIEIPITQGFAVYLNWISDSTSY